MKAPGHSAASAVGAQSAEPQKLIYGREGFLKNLKNKREFSDNYIPCQPTNNLPNLTLANKSLPELIDIAATRAAQVFATFIVTTRAELPGLVGAVVAEKGGGQVLVPTDPRFAAFGLKPQGNPLVVWQPAPLDEDGYAQVRADNLAGAANANVGVAFADYFAAESCSSVVVSGPGQGRALHFLPKHYISIVPASVIVPRTTGAAKALSENPATAGRTIHFISGPSNSADIELELVVGLHGPLSVTYLIVSDA